MLPGVSIHASAREATAVRAGVLDFVLVSIHASAREATDGAGNTLPCGQVSIHASAREATRYPGSGGCIGGVSIHASAREATAWRCCKWRRATRFDPRLRAGGDDHSQTAYPNSRSFDPRLRAGGDGRDRRLASARVVSIHASAREATLTRLTRDRGALFRSTPPRGRRPYAPCAVSMASMFRSTPPRGRRPAFQRDSAPSVVFRSTPPRGRRLAPVARQIRQTGFDPRLRAGGDLINLNPPDRELTFRSTPPRGRRPRHRGFVAQRLQRFDPRLRAGGDAASKEAPRGPESFDPRLRAGGDPTTPTPTTGCGGFDPRLRAGGDAVDATEVEFLHVSIHASAREATYAPCAVSMASMFRSTPPRGRRRAVPLHAAQCSPVSIHASAREATVYVLDTKRPHHVSIHASAREATACRAKGQGIQQVSIHASAREATIVAMMDAETWLFRSTPPRGRRLSVRRTRCSSCVFRSTPPRGRRPPGPDRSGGPRGFDPRLRAGGDLPYYKVYDVREKFRSTPPRGRRRGA